MHFFLGEIEAASGVMSHARVTGGGSAGAPLERAEEGEDAMAGYALKRVRDDAEKTWKKLGKNGGLLLRLVVSIVKLVVASELEQLDFKLERRGEESHDTTSFSILCGSK